jgi:hypothetical protein
MLKDLRNRNTVGLRLHHKEHTYILFILYLGALSGHIEPVFQLYLEPVSSFTNGDIQAVHILYL